MDLNILALTFIPLFVAIDVLGVVPLFLSLTQGLTPKEKRTLVTEATLTALAVSIVFLFGGRLIFDFMGITEDDFRVGGGIVLLVLAVDDLIFSSESRRNPETKVGIVPIGIPLIIGPAALTTLLILNDTYGKIPAIISLLVNLLIVWVVFRKSDLVSKLLGEAGSKAVAKVAALFMAGIAVMMIRVGLTAMLAGKG
ncbi:MAG: MarC family protein [Bacteroidetes bacterium]|jgi:multiple antibiotic resistance protein|nr:MarC family protein [Bacteroidota bacterium]